MLSVVLATHNEAANIGRCLEAVHSLAGEIIIVDGESSDDTVKIAKSYGAAVISTTNKANFHINKQMAIDEASGDLVLQLDADEVVDGDLAAWITRLHKNLDADRSSDGPVAWYLKRKNYFLNRFLTKGGQYPDPVIRLFIRDKARLPQKNVHEQMEVDGQTGFAEGHLLHYPYPNLAHYMAKFNTYTSFEAGRLRDEGEIFNTFGLLKYLFIKPVVTFVSLYLRHKGFVDGMPGFTFALLSSLHHPFVYLKLKELELQ
jgi:glycosyltransferase involved in cell wall biosynthesis